MKRKKVYKRGEKIRYHWLVKLLFTLALILTMASGNVSASAVPEDDTEHNEDNGYFTSDKNTIVLDTEIKGQSTNAHTKTFKAWTKGDTFYLAVGSTHKLEGMILNTKVCTDYKEFGVLPDGKVETSIITINDIPYNVKTLDLNGNINDSRWTVFKYKIDTLGFSNDGSYPIHIDGIGNGHDVENSELLIHIPKLTVTGNKAWINGPKNPVNLTLYKKAGTEKTKVNDYTLTTSNPSFEESNLPYTDDYGRIYTYTIKEAPQEGYTFTVDSNYDEDKQILTFNMSNEYKSPMIKISGKKTWVNDSLEDRPECITIDLYRHDSNPDLPQDEVLIDSEEVYPNEAGDWLYDFGSHPKTDEHGNPYNYYLKEEIIYKYSTIYEPLRVDPKNPYHIYLDITNTLKYGNLNVHKVDSKGELIIGGEEKSATFEVTSGSTNESFKITTNPNTGIATLDLKPGSYTLEEVVAPYGYKVNNTIYNIEVYANDDNDIVVTVNDANPQSVTTNNANVLIVTNDQIMGKVKITKVDETNEMTKLKGAIFELRDNTGHVILTESTDDNGEITWENIPLGTYQLIETKAPSGYFLIREPIPVELTVEYNKVTLTIPNTLAPVIPHTGGFGITIFIITGIGLMGASAIIYKKISNKKKLLDNNEK